MAKARAKRLISDGLRNFKTSPKTYSATATDRQDKSWETAHTIHGGGRQPTTSPAAAGFSIMFADSVYDAKGSTTAEAEDLPLPARGLFGPSRGQVSMD
jgi:hypothetical protein